MSALRTLVVVVAVAAACSDPPTAPRPAAGSDATSATDSGGLDAQTAEAKAVDATADSSGETASEVAANLDATSEGGPAKDAAVEAAGDVPEDLDAAGAADAALDAEATADVAPPPDAAVDVAVDGPSDAAVDAAGDAALDAAVDGVDSAGLDAAQDAGSDANADLAAEAAGDAAAASDAATEVAAEVPPGCADGTREGFLDKKKFPLVAACAGAWDIPGIHKGNPACGRKAGNTGANAPGKGCNVEDLCAEGWHVCYGAKDLKERNPEGCGGILDGGGMSPAFFLARTSSTGAFNCSQDSTKFGDPGTSNDLFGCGDLGCGIDFKTYPSCDPLNRASHDLCKGLRNDLNCGDWCAHLGKFPGQKNTWDCGKNAPTNEANLVVKGDPAVQGGVLCCVDFITKP
ncbi:MAG: hypothetical protein FJ100_07220 [Deltaproteobacteria bacterium]|nr:hypothetical protein [Deltaproteobacteria bacterium]